ncbi:BcsR/BcsP family cellulose biosynthesis protein [Chitinimonas sp.]|uniref:BcsR/BcsP family cellulose biosynthesis protein n=1 Tax=Chitinimonas sp. TaxID=1934313 RepID=UPI0035B3CE3E
MGDDIMGLNQQFRGMPIAYAEIRAVENTTQSVRQWAMLNKICNSHAPLNTDTPLLAVSTCQD